MNNADVARVFDEIADLLEIQGADHFRINSYRRVARTINDLVLDVNEVSAAGELAGLPGVGKSSAAKIRELLETGTIQARTELLEKVPATVLELLHIPTLGPKKVALLWRERGIASIEDLKQEIESDALAGLKGFGDKTIDQIRRGIAFRERSAGRILLGVAWDIAANLREQLAAMTGVRRVESAGSLRRGRETIGDLDLLCIADDGARVVNEFTALPGVTEVLAAGATKGSVLLEYRPGRTIQVDLRVVPDHAFGAAWQYFTGSKEHNVRLRERAVKRGWSLNEYGLTEDEHIIASVAEEDIYAALGLPWIPPELREDRGEMQLSEIPADLLTQKHIRGDLHMHTVASDGHNTISEMAVAAKERGYDYICITDHSHNSAIANGLDEDRLRKHIADIRRADREIDGITVFAGTEVDILALGQLDYPDKLLDELDFVVASIHSGMGQDIEANTRRTLAAIENPYVNCIGHPTGRLINDREAMALDIEAICQAAASAGTALELNANAWRLDLKDQHIRCARDAGVTIAVNTDAHATDQLDQIHFGMLTARRGWLRKSDVLNTRTVKQVRSFVEKKRKQG